VESLFLLDLSDERAYSITAVKILGKRKTRSPLENIKAQSALIQELEKTRPYKKPRGLILRFKTWAELDAFNRERAAKKT